MTFVDLKKNLLENAKLLIISILISSIALLVISATLFVVKVAREKHLESEKMFLKYSTQLVTTSNFLTTNVYKFIDTGNYEFYDLYYEEINLTKSREEAVKAIEEIYFTTDKTNQDAQKILELSNELVALEETAFKYAKDDKLIEAKSLIYGNKYQEKKEQINEIYTNLIKHLEKNIKKENVRVTTMVHTNFFVTFVASLIIIFSSIRLTLNYYKISSELEIDQLTGLLNSYSYKKNIQKLIDDKPTKFGALIYTDIDNFKNINEGYGHRNGDLYIQHLAKKFNAFDEVSSVAARLVDDKFIIYVHGFDSEVETRAYVNYKIKEILASYFVTTMNIEEKYRFSSGVAIYPKDSSNIDELVKYADYSMINLKKYSKGEIVFYDKNEFSNEYNHKLNKKCLMEVIENEDIEIALQPIVDANNFEVYGYEALMRPKSESITSPLQLLKIAKEENKLDEIERLALKKAFEKIDNAKDNLKNKKIFVNSIADRILSREEVEEYQLKYSKILDSVIIEVTEKDFVPEKIFNEKSSLFRNAGALMALDNYGSGTANEFALLSGKYDIIKVDIKLTKNIDTNIKNQELVRSIIRISKINKFKVLAEGVETKKEFITLRNIGVHYLQGYFIGKPNFQVEAPTEESIQFFNENCLV